MSCVPDKNTLSPVVLSTDGRCCCAPLCVQHYFGDGLAWAGCTIIALTKQQRRFEVFDFCGHILRAWNIDHKESDHMGINVGRFVEIASQKQVLSSQIFNMLDKFLNFPEFKDEPEYIPPPNPDADAETAV